MYTVIGMCGSRMKCTQQTPGESDQKVCSPLIAQMLQRGGPGDVCYPQTHRRLSSASRRIAHSSAGDCRRYAKPAGESTQTERRLTPSAQVESMVVGLKWSSPYRLKRTMMSDRAWMDLAAVGGMMQTQRWQKGRGGSCVYARAGRGGKRWARERLGCVGRIAILVFWHKA